MDQPLTAARLHLADARRRGQPFVVAWPAALDAALAASGDAELAETFDALTATWPAWWADTSARRYTSPE